jgi:hypothetical protein
VPCGSYHEALLEATAPVRNAACGAPSAASTSGYGAGCRARRVLRPGGALSISESATDPDYQLDDGVRDLCRASGFELLHHSGERLGYTMCFTAP